MNVYQRIGQIFAMDEETWRKHANPWSGWTRGLLGLPLLCLAIWSRVWIGWGALGALALVILWIWYNPRMFATPKTFDAWLSKGCWAKKVFMENRADISKHHRVACDILAWLSVPGIVVMGIGLWQLWLDWVVLGAVLGAMPKFWFIDRMVWVLQDWQSAGREVWATK